MAQKVKVQGKKLRDDLEAAHGIYEDWMEPDWRGSTITSHSSDPKDPRFKDRGKFKFANEYERDISTIGNSASKNDLKHSDTNLNSSKNLKDWIYKDTDFERFYAWVTNGTIKDIHLVKSILFDE